MKKLFLTALTALALAGSADACSARAGYVINGMLPTPAGLTQECGALYRAFVGSNDFKWAELYRVNTSSAGSIGKTLESRLRSKGFILLQTKEIKNGKMFGYGNPSTSKIVVLQIVFMSNSLYLTVTGN